MSRFSYPHTSVNFTHRYICYASMESCFQGLSFIYLHLRPLNNLWGLYDPKTENMAGFLPIMEQFLHIELSAMPLLKDLIFISFSYTHEPWAVFRTLWPKNMKILWWISSLSNQTSPRHWAFKTVNFSLHHSYLNIERFVKTSNRQVSWISLTSRLCKHYLFQWTGHNVASCIGKQYCIGMQRISQFSWYSDAVRIFKVQLYISQKPAGFGYTEGSLGLRRTWLESSGM